MLVIFQQYQGIHLCFGLNPQYSLLVIISTISVWWLTKCIDFLLPKSINESFVLARIQEWYQCCVWFEQVYFTLRRRTDFENQICKLILELIIGLLFKFNWQNKEVMRWMFHACTQNNSRLKRKMAGEMYSELMGRPVKAQHI